MIRPKRIVSIDPAGDVGPKKFGTTGIAIGEIVDGKYVLLETFIINNKEYKSFEKMNLAINSIIWHYGVKDKCEDYVVIEDFRLDPMKAKTLTWDPLMTPQLIGALRVQLEEDLDNKVILQYPSIKTAYKKKGIFEARFTKSPDFKGPWNRHTQDAVRHAIHAVNTIKKEEK